MRKYLLFAGIIAIAGLVINYSLGGFTTVEPGLVSTEAITIYGYSYEGRYNSRALDELINELRTQVANQDGNSQLTIINYLQPELEKKGTVKQFVGIIGPNHLPVSQYDSLVIPPYNGAQFRIPVRPLVMPSPEKLKGMAASMANEMGTALEGYSVEQYQDKTLVINFPFRRTN